MSEQESRHTRALTAHPPPLVDPGAAESNGVLPRRSTTAPTADGADDRLPPPITEKVADEPAEPWWQTPEYRAFAGGGVDGVHGEAADAVDSFDIAAAASAPKRVRRKRARKGADATTAQPAQPARSAEPAIGPRTFTATANGAAPTNGIASRTALPPMNTTKAMPSFGVAGDRAGDMTAAFYSSNRKPDLGEMIMTTETTQQDKASANGTAPPIDGATDIAATDIALETETEATEATEAGAAEQAGIGPGAGVLGAATWLMARSPAHRHAFLADLEWRLMPAIALGQCRLVQQDGKPVAFISWASVSDEVESRLAAGDRRIRPDEWNTGDRRVFVDVVAPFGGAEALVKEIREKVFGELGEG